TDPTNRGALPTDQEEPDQAGSIENLIDTDRDGIGDSVDTDDDGDGVPDTEDLFPLDATEFADFDGDGTGDFADLDDDCDGTPDTADAFPFDPAEVADFDGDGIGDIADLDDDGDGTPDTADAFPLNPAEVADFDGDGIGDVADLDDDGDGTPDTADAFPLNPAEVADFDGDGLGDVADLDDDGDGTPDTADAFPFDPAEVADFDGDGIGDVADLDDDGDGTPDTADAFPFDPAEVADFDGDGLGDVADLDDDGDGTPDTADAFPLNPSEVADFDQDGTGDNADLDDDGDGVADLLDPEPFNALVSQLFAALNDLERTAIEGDDRVAVLSTSEGLKSGVSSADATGKVLFAGQDDAVGFSTPATPRAEQVQSATVTLAARSADSQLALGGPAVSEVPGLSWTKLESPVRVFEKPADDRAFRDLQETVLLASGRPANLSAFAGRLTATYGGVDLVSASTPVLLGDGTGPFATLGVGLPVQQVYGAALLDVAAGALSGALDVVLFDDAASASDQFPRYFSRYNAQLQSGTLTNVQLSETEFLVTDAPFSVLTDGTLPGVSFRAPALGTLSGFLTGDSAEYLQLAFGFKTAARDNVDVRGLALLQSYALTQLETEALASQGLAFAAVTCCDADDVGVFGGRAAGEAVGVVAPVFAVSVDENFDPLSPTSPDFGALEPASAGNRLAIVRTTVDRTITDLAVPPVLGAEGLSAQRWDTFNGGDLGPSLDVFDAQSGSLLGAVGVPDAFFFWTGVPSAFVNLSGTATYTNSVLLDAALSGSLIASLAVAPDPRQDFAARFDIDFGTGAITNGKLAFGLSPAAGLDALFSGQVYSAQDGNAVELLLTEGVFFGVPLDPLRSTLGGFFAGAAGDAFAGAFKLITDEPTPSLATGLFLASRGPLDLPTPVLSELQRSSLLQGSEIGLTTRFGVDPAQPRALNFALADSTDAQQPVLALALSSDPFAALAPDRAATLDLADAFLAGSESGGVLALPSSTSSVTGLNWYRWPAPVRVFTDAGDADLFADVQRALLVAVGTPSTFADLTATTSLFFNLPADRLFSSSNLVLTSPTDPLISPSSVDALITSGGSFGPSLGAASAFEVANANGLLAQQVYGFGALDIQQASFEGGLEVVLQDGNSVESRYLGLYSALISNGAFAATPYADAVYIPQLLQSNPDSLLLNTNLASDFLSFGSADIGAELQALSVASVPATGDIAGFFTGPSASALQLSFGFDAASDVNASIDGLALLSSQVLTSVERASLSGTNVGFVALQCCFSQGIMLGRALEGVTPETSLLFSVAATQTNASVQLGEPDFWFDPGLAGVEPVVFRFQQGAAEALTLPAAFASSVAGTRWLGSDALGDSAALVDGNSGLLLTSVRDLLFLTASPTVIFPTVTAERTFSADVILTGQVFDRFAPELVLNSLDGTSMAFGFNIDLATGEIPYGNIQFALPNNEGEVSGRFAGAARYEANYQYVELDFFDGTFGVAPLDIVASEIQGFFEGPNAERFVGGFSLFAENLPSISSNVTLGAGPSNLAEGLFVASQGTRRGSGVLTDAEKLLLVASDTTYFALDTGFFSVQPPGQEVGVAVDNSADPFVANLLLGRDPDAQSLPFTGVLTGNSEVLRVEERAAVKINLPTANASGYFINPPHDLRSYGALAGEERRRFNDYLLVTTLPAAAGFALDSGHLFYRSDELSFQLRAALDSQFSEGGSGALSFNLDWNTGAITQGVLRLNTDGDGDGLSVFFSGGLVSQGESVATQVAFDGAKFVDADSSLYQTALSDASAAAFDASASIMTLYNRENGTGVVDFLSSFALVVRNGDDLALGDLLFAGLGRTLSQDLSLTTAEQSSLAFGQGDSPWGYVGLTCCDTPQLSVSSPSQSVSGGFLLQGVASDDSVTEAVLVNPVAGGAPLTPSDVGFYDGQSPNSFYRQGAAPAGSLELAPEVAFWGSPPGLPQPFGPKPLLVDAFGELLSPPAPIESLLFQRAPLAALPFSGPAPFGTFAGRFSSGSLGVVDAGISGYDEVALSFNVDYFTGTISEGRLSVTLVEQDANGQPAVVDFGFSGSLPGQGNSLLPQGFASLSLDDVFSTATFPVALPPSELFGFFTGTEVDGFEFRGAANLLGDDGFALEPFLLALLKARSDVVDQNTSNLVPLEQRLTSADWARWTEAGLLPKQRFGLAAFPIVSFESSASASPGGYVQHTYELADQPGVFAPGFAPALEGVLMGRGSRYDAQAVAEFVLGANALIDRQTGSDIFRADFLQQPFDVVLTGSGLPSSPQTFSLGATSDFDVDWGIWNAGVAQNVPTDASLGPIIDQVLYATGVPTPQNALPTGVVNYGVLSLSESLFARIGSLGAGIQSPSAPGALQMNEVSIAFALDFDTGVISNGSLVLAYADPEAQSSVDPLRWTGDFTGQARGAMAQFELTDLSITRAASLETLVPDLTRSTMAGFVTGPSGERFLGSLSFEAQGDVTGALESLQGVFLMQQQQLGVQ
ncbi:MAG: hypothetical protein RLZZ174_21, partial [Pseudomonadota bacterium]